MIDRETHVIVLHETVLQSWARDAGSFAMIVGIIGVGVALDSSAMQWVGAVCAFLALIGRASGKTKRLTKAEAIEYIESLDKVDGGRV